MNYEGRRKEYRGVGVTGDTTGRLGGPGKHGVPNRGVGRYVMGSRNTRSQ